MEEPKGKHQMKIIVSLSSDGPVARFRISLQSHRKGQLYGLLTKYTEMCIRDSCMYLRYRISFQFLVSFIHIMTFMYKMIITCS